MAKVVTLGELMIRLQPYNYERFIQADHLEFTFGGGEAMTDLCQYVDVCISNEENAKDVFGIEKVAITLRESRSAFDNGWSAMLYGVKRGEYCFFKKYDLHIIDRVGGSDGFGRIQR